MSIGGGDGISSPYYLDPIAIGSYGAVSRGVFVSSSGGNDGPSGMSVTNLAPWLTTVGAGTIDRDFPAEVILGNGRRLSGVSLYSGEPLKGKMYPLIYPGKSGVLTDSLCMENSLDPELVKGKIVVCDRGSSARVAKGLVVKKAGGVGMILANGISNGEGLVGDAHLLPACALGANFGDEIKEYINFSANPTATIDFKGTVVGIRPAPVVASFSARGPNGLSLEILKPDLTAPGVNSLDRWAALLKSAHPDWSPAAIRSAMMTTATVFDNTNALMIDQATGNASTPYDFGAGHLNLALAMDPGLVYNITPHDYVTFLCAIAVKKRSFVVTVTADGRNLELGQAGAVFGSLSWTDGKHVVRSPMVVTQAQPL
ncbi:Subtilisin-like protease [Glycine soja]|nr:Subtilisin-like protease [Glycine soja]